MQLCLSSAVITKEFMPISIQVIKEMTGGGADYSFECIGSTSVMAEAFESSTPARAEYCTSRDANW